MRLGLGLAGLAVAGLWSGVAVGEDDKNEVVILEPRTPWNVDFGEQRCRLARVFDDGEDRHLLLIDQGGPSSRFHFSVSGPAFKNFDRPSEITVQFGAFEPDKDRFPYLGTTKDVGTSLIYSGLDFGGHGEEAGQDGEDPSMYRQPFPLIDVEMARKVDSITVRQGRRVVELATGNLGEPISVLNECARNIVRVWGFDPDEQATMTRRARWLDRRKVSRLIAHSYPNKALRRGEQGIFRLRATIEIDGSVSECFIDKATLTDSLESPACKGMAKAQFEPALDKDGNPMRSFYLTTISYRIN